MVHLKSDFVVEFGFVDLLDKYIAKMYEIKRWVEKQILSFRPCKFVNILDK